MASPIPVGSITSQINSTAGTTCNPAIPTGLTNGQHWMVFVAMVNGNKTASMNTPSGWTHVTGSPFLNSASTGTLAVLYKKFATGDTAPALTWTTNNKNAGGIVAYQNADLTTFLDAAVSSATGSSTAPASPSVAAVTRGATRLHIHGTVVTGAGTPSFDHVERLDAVTSNTGTAAIYLSDQAGMAEGATGTRTATAGNGSWAAVTLWLRPATATSFGLLQSARVTVNSNSPSVALPNAGTSGSLLTASLAGSNAARGLSGFSYSGGAFTQTQVPVGARVYIVGQFYFANNTSTGTITITGTLTGTADNSTLYIAEWLGADTSSPLDAVGANNGVGTTTATVTTGSAATSGGILCLAVVGSDDASSLTADANYILRYAQTSLSIAAGGTESRETTGGSTQTATFTTGNTVNGWNMQVACFKAASAVTTVAAVALSRSGAAALTAAARPLTAQGRPAPRLLGAVRPAASVLAAPAPRVLSLGRGAGVALARPGVRSLGAAAGAPTARSAAVPRTSSTVGRPLSARGPAAGTGRGTLTATAVAQLTARALTGAVARGQAAGALLARAVGLGRTTGSGQAGARAGTSPQPRSRGAAQPVPAAQTRTAPRSTGLSGRPLAAQSRSGGQGRGLLIATAVVQAVARGVTGVLARATGRSQPTGRTASEGRGTGLLTPRAPGGTARSAPAARSSPAPALTARAGGQTRSTSAAGAGWAATARAAQQALGAARRQLQALAPAAGGGTALLDVLGALSAFFESVRVYHLPAVAHRYVLPAVAHVVALPARLRTYVLPAVAHLFGLPPVAHLFTLEADMSAESLIYEDPQAKAAADILPFGVDATLWLGTAHLVAVTTTITGRNAALTKGGTGRPAPPQIDATNTKVTQWLSGGTPGYTYLLHFDLTDDATPARQIRASIQVEVR